MRFSRLGLIGCLALALAMPSAPGCGIVADVFDPGLALQFGFDPATVFPETGTIIVALKNSTPFSAVFLTLESASASNLTADSRIFSVEVAPGGVGNEVVDCPVALVMPQVILVATPEGVEEVEYQGLPLMSGDAYTCGDVIEIQLTAFLVGDEIQFGIVVRVIPGR